MLILLFDHLFVCTFCIFLYSICYQQVQICYSLHPITAALEATEYSALSGILFYEHLTMGQAMCRDIAIINDISQEEFRVRLQPRRVMGVDVQYAPRHATVVIVDDDVPSKQYIVHI